MEAKQGEGGLSQTKDSSIQTMDSNDESDSESTSDDLSSQSSTVYTEPVQVSCEQ